MRCARNTRQSGVDALFSRGEGTVEPAFGGGVLRCGRWRDGQRRRFGRGFGVGRGEGRKACGILKVEGLMWVELADGLGWRG